MYTSVETKRIPFEREEEKAHTVSLSLCLNGRVCFKGRSASLGTFYFDPLVR